MLLPKHIDLHMHSTCSDGTDEPLELLEKVRETGLNMFSLTDHDATAGCETILKNWQTALQRAVMPVSIFWPELSSHVRTSEGNTIFSDMGMIRTQIRSAAWSRPDMSCA